MATPGERLETQDKELFDEINKYVDELKGYAQGDLDFVIKYLKKQFASALGTDDAARADFFSKVANQLEERVGRIPFDFELKTGREREDLLNFYKQKDAEDVRQREQEFQFTEQQELASGNEQKGIKESSNESGFLGSGIEKRQSAEATEERRVNIIDPKNREFAFQQALRDENRRLGKVSSDRNIFDITTGARRAGQDEVENLEFGTEKAERTLAERLADIERTKAQQLRSGLDLQTTSSLDNLA